MWGMKKLEKWWKMFSVYNIKMDNINDKNKLKNYSEAT